LRYGGTEHRLSFWFIGQHLNNLPSNINTDYRHIAKPWPLGAILWSRESDRFKYLTRQNTSSNRKPAIQMTLNKYLFVIANLCLGCHVTKQVEYAACESYHRGLFVQNKYNNSGLGHWTSMSFLTSRTDTSERVITTGAFLPHDTSYYRINWRTACKYELTYVSSTNKFLDSLINKDPSIGTIQCAIVKDGNGYYIKKCDEEADTVWIR
jgi:hypothetical protein